jgi:predicted RNA-binding Zn ribbon-like protein
MQLAGGHPALDFVNTLAGLRSTGPLPDDEHLYEYNDLLTFAVRAETLSPDAAERLSRTARRQPAEAEAAFHAALEMRAVLEGVFRPLAEGSPPTKKALGALRKAGESALAHGELVPADGGFRWSWEGARGLEAPLWPLAHGAVELLTGDSLARLKICGRCRWLFLDVSKNRSRRWCSMDECGTHEKIERYVERRRAARR